nr:immunoglobulin heavy chain junction region [Macaca mulatta]MOY21389.1 immunoglobulin heavy chain junction region [Macaca mulatta]MOY21395.1 immunoglobulin heavy chain junction region [Macaca mulatta]MOY21557.1 immunoglobulin heavy chain junction region [Macaca mulatta]MOY21578.1 immunoglobulin heavy chain junction region [Macaca mulatta]
CAGNPPDYGNVPISEYFKFW